MGSGRRAKAVLAVGTAAPLGTAERYAVHSAIALLTLTTERSRALQEAEQRLGAAVLKMLLVGRAITRGRSPGSSTEGCWTRRCG